MWAGNKLVRVAPVWLRLGACTLLLLVSYSPRTVEGAQSCDIAIGSRGVIAKATN